MRQKMTIFKEENSVCRGAKFSNITKWHYFLDELNLKLQTKFDKFIFRDSWQKLVSEFHGMLGNCSKSLNFEDFSEIS